MHVFIARRLLASIPVLVLVSLLSFLILRVAPGDPVIAALGDATDAIDPAVHEALRRRLGLDEPLLQQYVDWILGALRLDFGVSILTRQPIAEEILQRLPISVEIAVMSMLLTLLVALPLGMLSAVHHNRPVDHIVRVLTGIGLSLPSFWVGLLILIALVTIFHWLPPLKVIPLSEDPIGNLAQFAAPALAVSLHASAVLARVVRASMLEVLDEDYVRTARSKGLPEWMVVARHAFRNSLPPVLATIGVVAASILTGTIVIETVFNMPGLGRYLIDSITRRDYPVLQAVMMLTAVVVIITNLVVDIVQGMIDPRVGTA